MEDENGLLYIRDRNKELIKVNSYQVAVVAADFLGQVTDLGSTDGARGTAADAPRNR